MCIRDRLVGGFRQCAINKVASHQAIYYLRDMPLISSYWFIGVTDRLWKICASVNMENPTPPGVLDHSIPVPTRRSDRQRGTKIISHTEWYGSYASKV